jgi:copper chaperone
LPDIRTATLQIEGMHCGGCVNRVSMALSRIPGVKPESVDVGTARVSYDASTAAPQQLVDAVNGIGFVARAA